MTNSTLEKVARAITQHFEQQGVAIELDDGAWLLEAYVSPADLARAALQSLRQVDDETVEAMKNSSPLARHWPSTVTTAFTAAIDHILTEGGEG